MGVGAREGRDCKLEVSDSLSSKRRTDLDVKFQALDKDLKARVDRSIKQALGQLEAERAAQKAEFALLKCCYGHVVPETVLREPSADSETSQALSKVISTVATDIRTQVAAFLSAHLDSTLQDAVAGVEAKVARLDKVDKRMEAMATRLEKIDMTTSDMERQVKRIASSKEWTNFDDVASGQYVCRRISEGTEPANESADVADTSGKNWEEAPSPFESVEVVQVKPDTLYEAEWQPDDIDDHPPSPKRGPKLEDPVPPSCGDSEEATIPAAVREGWFASKRSPEGSGRVTPRALVEGIMPTMDWGFLKAAAEADGGSTPPLVGSSKTIIVRRGMSRDADAEVSKAQFDTTRRFLGMGAPSSPRARQYPSDGVREPSPGRSTEDCGPMWNEVTPLSPCNASRSLNLPPFSVPLRERPKGGSVALGHAGVQADSSQAMRRNSPALRAASPKSSEAAASSREVIAVESPAAPCPSAATRVTGPWPSSVKISGKPPAAHAVVAPPCTSKPVACCRGGVNRSQSAPHDGLRQSNSMQGLPSSGGWNSGTPTPPCTSGPRRNKFPIIGGRTGTANAREAGSASVNAGSASGNRRSLGEGSGAEGVLRTPR